MRQFELANALGLDLGKYVQVSVVQVPEVKRSVRYCVNKFDILFQLLIAELPEQ